MVHKHPDERAHHPVCLFTLRLPLRLRTSELSNPHQSISHSPAYVRHLPIINTNQVDSARQVTSTTCRPLRRPIVYLQSPTCSQPTTTSRPLAEVFLLHHIVLAMALLSHLRVTHHPCRAQDTHHSMHSNHSNRLPARDRASTGVQKRLFKDWPAVVKNSYPRSFTTEECNHLLHLRR